MLRSYALHRSNNNGTPSLSFLPRLNKNDGRTVEEKAEEAVLQAFVSLLDITIDKEKAEVTKQTERLGKDKLRGLSSSNPDEPCSTLNGKDNNNKVSPKSTATDETNTTPDYSTIYSHQTCYLNHDESELCTYDNILCFDGEGPVVIVPKPIREPTRVLDYNHECNDNRFNEPTTLEWSNCHWAYAVKRDYRIDDVPDEISGGEYSLPLGLRRWGPQNRNTALIFRELSPTDIFGSGEENLHTIINSNDDDIKNIGKNKRKKYVEDSDTLNIEGFNAQEVLTMIDNADSFANIDIPGLTLKGRYRVPNLNEEERITVDWIDGTLWLGALELQWQENPYQFMSKASLLYEAQLANATVGFGSANGAAFETGGHPSDGYVHWQSDSDIAVRRSIHKLESKTGIPEARSRALWRVGSQWGPLPPIDNILFVGEGAKRVADISHLNSWASGILRLINQRNTKVFFNDAQKQYDSKHLLCARRGAVLGTKPKLFSGRSDATLFRNRAYKAAGIGIDNNGVCQLGSYPRFPPRRITIIDRVHHSGRFILNIDELTTALSASGLEFEIVDNLSRLSFEEQVSLMARTGILIAPHGAALTNIMFLPAHAAVIELFPYGLRRTHYNEIANTLSLLYYPVYSLTKLPPTTDDNDVAKILYSKGYYENCVKPNTTVFDGISVHECHQVGRLHPVIIPMDYFNNILTNAIDAIGAFSQSNPEWAEYSSKENILPITYEEWTKGRSEELLKSGENYEV